VCAHCTDIIITINKEDYRFAKRKMKFCSIEYTPGIGVDTQKFHVEVDRDAKRRDMGLPESAFVILSVGELNKNKNHQVVLKALAEFKRDEIYYVICGEGRERYNLQRLIRELNLDGRVKLLGYRSDIAEIYRVADIFIIPSKREGLPVAAIEALASGLPVISSNVRGNNDYSVEGITGFRCDPDDYNGYLEAIKTLYFDADLRCKIGNMNMKVAEQFDLETVLNKVRVIYSTLGVVSHHAPSPLQ